MVQSGALIAIDNNQLFFLLYNNPKFTIIGRTQNIPQFEANPSVKGFGSHDDV